MKLIIFERNVDFSQSMLLWRGHPNVNEHLDGEDVRARQKAGEFPSRRDTKDLWC